MQTPTLKVQLAASLVLSGALCIACGSAPSDNFSSPSIMPSAGAGAGAVAGEAPSAAGAPSSSGAGGTTVTLDPSLPAAAGAGIGGAGIAGAAPTDPGAPRAMKSLVDDMEAMVSSIPEADGRVGYWYTFNDGVGMQLPAPNGPFLPDATSNGFPGSAHARRSQGAAFPSYAGFGFDLNNRSGQRLTYDASAYEGVVLWVRGNVSLRVMFPTRATAPTNQGGDCTSLCNDSFGVDLPASEQWREQAVSFASLRQRVPSDAAFDPKTLLGVAFAVPPGAQFDVWVDEIGFF